MSTTAGTAPANSVLARARNLYRTVAGSASSLQWAGLLAARLLVARVFFKSGLTKWDGLTIRDDTYYLFADEYFGKYALPEAATNTLAVGGAIAEIVLPALLVLGLFTRVAATGLLIMTMVIQVFVYPDAWWNVHAWWTAVLMIVILFGPGAASADRRIKLD